MAAGKLGNSEVLAIEAGKIIGLNYWDEINNLTIEQCEYVINSYDRGIKLTHEEVLAYKGGV